MIFRFGFFPKELKDKNSLFDLSFLCLFSSTFDSQTNNFFSLSLLVELSGVQNANDGTFCFTDFIAINGLILFSVNLITGD